MENKNGLYAIVKCDSMTYIKVYTDSKGMNKLNKYLTHINADIQYEIVARTVSSYYIVLRQGNITNTLRNNIFEDTGIYMYHATATEIPNNSSAINLDSPLKEMIL